MLQSVPSIKPSSNNHCSASESPMAMLYMRAQKVDPNRIGMIATSLSDMFISEKMEKFIFEYIKYGVAQWSLSLLGMTEAMLQVRELSPYLDLLDGNKKRIGHNQWIQTQEMAGDHHIDHNDPKRDSYSIYQTGKDVAIDKKIIIIYGLEFMNGFKKTKIDEIQIWRKNVQLLNKFPIDKNKKHPLFKGISYDDGLPDLELVNIEDYNPRNLSQGQGCSVLSNRNNLVYHNNMFIFHTPIMIRLNDWMDLRFVYPNGHAPCLTEVNEEIKVKGLVFEGLGESIYF